MAISTYDPLLDNENEPLLDEEAAAELLNVSPKTLRKWRCVGGGPEFIKVGRVSKYQPSALALPKKRRRRPAAPR